MPFPTVRSKGRVLAVALGSVVAVAAATATPSQVDASSTHLHFGKHTQVLNGLDNPRQLSVAPNGDLLVAEAGHGSYNPDNCAGSGQNQMCVGRSGSVLRIGRHGHHKTVMKGLLSGAGADGSFAVGSDGASKRLDGPYYSIITYAPPDILPQGLPG
ncbi:MAG: hypothetical protein QOK15_3771, partial [Nocardioidaceae bacterium]|nr:hypothetical protein [Nocardioidaceae bacterium]